MSSKAKWITPTVKQAWVSSATLLNKVGAGMQHGFASGLLAALAAPQSPLHMTLHTASWFVSSAGIPMVIGYLVSSMVMSRHGRRTAFALFTLPAIAGMLATACADGVPALFAGRLLTAVTVATTNALGAVVISEYTSPGHRGMLLNLKTASLNIGSLLAHVLSHYAGWRIVAAITTIPFVLSLAVTYTWPESPSWLVDQNRLAECEETFYYLRGRTEETTKEIQEMIQAQKHHVLRRNKRSCIESVVDFLGKFKKKNFLKPMLVAMVLMLMLELSGRHYFPSYAVQLIKEIVTEKHDPFLYNIILDVLITISSLIASYLIRVVKVRKLFLITGLVTVVLLNIACLFMYLSRKGVIPPEYSWMTLVLFAAFFVSANLGCSPIPLAIVGEIFPLEHRATGTAVAGCCMAVSLMAISKVLPHMVVTVEVYGAFAVIGGFMALGLVILYFILPETRGKTLQEIENFFNHGRYRLDDGSNERSKMMMS